jgi:oligopeptide transport system substrate-binding protein
MKDRNLTTNKQMKLYLALCTTIGFLLIFPALVANAANTNQTISLYTNAELSTLDISKITDRNSFNQIDNVDEGLYQYDQNGKVLKGLATKTTISKDKKTYTINIRKNTKWSNGDTVTAQDFVYSWQRAVTPATGSEYTYLFTNIKNASEIIDGKKDPSTLGVTATKKYQLKITLNRPQNYFKKILARETLYPLDEKVVNKYGKKYGTSSSKTVYNGPFISIGWNGTNDSWHLEKNPEYWDKKVVKLKKINYQVIKEPSTAYNLFQTKKLDIIFLVGEQAKQLANNKDLVKRPLAATEYLQYNEKKVAAFKNQDIRKAISLAINRKTLINSTLQNGSKTASGIVPANFVSNTKTGEDFAKAAYVKNTSTYNLKLAKRLFNQGLKQIDKKKLTVTLLVGNDDTSKQVGDFLQSQLETHLTNLKINVKSIPFQVELSDIDSGNYQLNLIDWSADFADPITFLELFTSDSAENHTGWSNTQYDTYINNSNNKNAANYSKRWKDLVNAAKVLSKEQGITTLYQANGEDLVNPKLKGVVYDKVNGHYSFQHAYLK